MGRSEIDDRRNGEIDRRSVLFALVAGIATGCSSSFDSVEGQLLPPTAGDLDVFLDRCIRCARCAEVCTAGCIEIHSPLAGPRLAGSPYIRPRQAGCNTCMRCTEVCPSGALTRTGNDLETVLAEVDMGIALIDHGLCLSHQGRVCGVCHDACPYPGRAIRLASQAKPEILDDCVGCGRCEERCPQVPSAIRVFEDEAENNRWRRS